MQMKSMADELYTRTDCRCIFLEIRFHRMSLETLKAGAQCLVQHIVELTKDTMVTSWNYEEQSISEEKLPEAIAGAKKQFSFCLAANVITPYVYNKKTLRDFSQTLRYDMELMNCERVSEDYWDCFDRHFAGCRSDEKLQKALYELFQEPGRSNRGYYNGYDLECLWSTSPYRNQPELYYGSLGVKLGIGCVTGQEQAAAERFAQWMKEICSIMGEANGLTGIVPAPAGWNISPYMWYFGRCETDERHTHEKENCTPMEWYPYSYLCGVEWRNVISPLTQSQLPHLVEDIAATPGVIQERLPGGGLLVGLEKSVLDVDVQDLLRLRRLVDPALYPGEGSSYHPWATMKHEIWGGPRGKWELVPIYPDEIVVRNGNPTFRKRRAGKAN